MAIFRGRREATDTACMARDRPTEKSEDSGVWPHIFPQSLPVCDQSSAGETPINERAGILGGQLFLYFAFSFLHLQK